MDIREALLEDLPDIQTLIKKLFLEEKKWHAGYEFDEDWAYSEDGIAYFNFLIANERGLVLVAENENNIVAYMACLLAEFPHPCRNKIHLAELGNTYILPEYRGKGYGKKMVDIFKKWAKKVGATQIKVSVFCANEDARKFYRAVGFDDFEIVMEQSLGE